MRHRLLVILMSVLYPDIPIAPLSSCHVTPLCQYIDQTDPLSIPPPFSSIHSIPSIRRGSVGDPLFLYVPP